MNLEFSIRGRRYRLDVRKFAEAVSWVLSCLMMGAATCWFLVMAVNHYC